MIRIGLLFHSSHSDNLGVGALTVSQVEIIRDIARSTGIEIAITIFDWAGKRPAYVTGPDIQVVTLRGDDLKSPRQLLRGFRACHVIVDIGAGDSFTDLYGPNRLWRMIYLKYLVHIARVPLVLAPQTYGPFAGWQTRIVAKDLLKRASVVATRDVPSTALLADLAPQRDVITASDVALRLPARPGRQVREAPVVGLNVSGLLMNGGYRGANDFALSLNYPEAMRGIIRRFLSLPDAPNVVLVPHVISPSQPTEDDLAASRALQAEFPAVQLAPHFASPSEAKSFIAGLDFMVGARMHACIAAFSSGVPVVPLAYSKKFEGMFGSLEYDATADCRKLDTAGAIEAVLDGYRRRDVLRHQVQIALGVGQTRLTEYTDALTRVVSAIALKKKAGDQPGYGPAPRWSTLDERL
ncbi:polysaccharide pyruvyl transferase WcaK-like protein [Litoreibacter ponti]|uniref:Polysaccharide pyruvyl transferase WcaK-like protein n=1 Tax=Litoreibacter ponti TaxID=1510457 RepID=A0A2T6BPE2_9RHOB|nr:polysaccharide pyruvyl transferase family protein [Litoreibacter ponti]PTX57941.1 polysaccharide pyruvyl transferase WcaK-like protein [Litoreibacter ponti]